jgi:ABC-type glutathione transport system ATPase component
MRSSIIRNGGINPSSKYILKIIEELGLQNCRNSRIGLSGVKKGISGGEARRLLFASELLNNPEIIFADEPTTVRNQYTYHVLCIMLSNPRCFIGLGLFNGRKCDKFDA